MRICPPPQSHEKKGSYELKKSFEEYSLLTNKLHQQRHEMKELLALLEKSGDEFGFLSDERYIEIRDKVQHTQNQINEVSQQIADFEQRELPKILGGTFDSIVANPHDHSQGVHSYYYHEFRDAFREYMAEYVSKGRDADNGKIKMAFNKLKMDLRSIDPSVNLIKFEEFMDKIRATVNE